jgi:hypothetical protein
VYADELLLPWLRGLLERLPGLRLFDAHTHLGGNDPEGWRCSPAEVSDALALVDGRGVVFPLMERAGYRAANDAVLAAADASGGRLVPFCRVDPGADAVGELERCLAAGAHGVELPPRAERFDHPPRPLLPQPTEQALLASTLVCVTIGVLLPFSPLADTLGFTSLPLGLLAVLAAMIPAYLLLLELGKRRFYRIERAGPRLARPRPPRQRRIHTRASRWSIRSRPRRTVRRRALAEKA